jgi:Rps23 Pro-64 3,4-dihydroxylase Tpa1-like proline 4-hydroxylase
MTIIFNPDELAWTAEEFQTKYREAAPFPHIAIDDFLPSADYATLSADFPPPQAPLWHEFHGSAENKKLQSNNFYAIPPSLRGFINECNGPAFVRFLERMTGIENLIPDPHLYGGGLHQTKPGGHLGLHIDYNFHETWNVDRRLNVIFYLNDEWEDSWGGHLELWDKPVEKRVQSIAPKGNRLVVFNTDEFSWHGHPDPLACPPGKTRRSIALYYYSNGRPDSEAANAHNTVFKERPGEVRKLTTKERLREWVPPAVLRLTRGMRTKVSGEGK